MKLKLTHSQFMALYSLLEQLLNNAETNESPCMEEKLLAAILASIYKKFYSKAIEKKKKYALSLTATEALAFWLFFTKFNYLPYELSFEANLIHTICNNIHQKFS